METPLSELYIHSSLFRALRNRSRISEKCQDCFYAKLCCGGLKCLSYAMTGDPFKADPGCWRATINHPAARLAMTTPQYLKNEAPMRWKNI
jgi:hypothetical protein